jgi:hypothetical protein
MDVAPSRRVLLRRWITVCICLLLLLFAGAAISPHRDPPPKITEEQVELIQVGMSLHEVEAILDCRPGNYTYRDDFLPIDMEAYSKEQQERKANFKEWAADTPDPQYTDDNGPNRQEAIAVRVWFDADGKVIDKCRMGYSYTWRQPTLFDRLKKLIPTWITK